MSATSSPLAASPNSSDSRLVTIVPEPEPDRRRLESRVWKQREHRLAPGQIIAGTSWRIMRWLGEGSVGVVYEAQHVEIGRRAAIKIVKATLAEDPAAIDDFRAEARASAKIGSPNIADVIDFVVLGDGRLMMAMEFVPGPSLHEVLVAEGRMAPARVIGILRQVCKGLQAAHAAGLVHRDVKPENIMLGTIAGCPDTVKIVDFGIATILGERAARHAGTPYYMPPEGMSSAALDGRYDVYSVGCMMYEMLTGAPPYVDSSLERVLWMHMSAPLPSFAAHDATHDAELPAELIQVVLRCLAKLPEDRHASMIELEAALCEAQIAAKLRTAWDDLPLPPLEPERLAKLRAKLPTRGIARRGMGWWLPILLGCGIACGSLVVVPMLGEAPMVEASVSPTSEVEALVARAHEAAALASFVYPPVDDPQADTAYTLVARIDALDGVEASDAAQSLRDEFASTLVRLGDETLAKPGGEAFALDFYVQALLFDPEIEPARSLVTLSPGELLALRRKAGSGQFSEAELIAVEPLAAFVEPSLAGQHAKLEAIRARRSAQRRASASDQLDTLLASGAVALAPAPPEPLALGEVQPGGTRVGSADRLVAKAQAEHEAMRLDGAKRLYFKALRLEPRRADALEGLAGVYFDQGKYSKAVTYYELAVRRATRDADLRVALGDAYVKRLDFDQALEQYAKAKLLGSSRAADRIARIERGTR